MQWHAIPLPLAGQPRGTPSFMKPTSLRARVFHTVQDTLEALHIDHLATHLRAQECFCCLKMLNVPLYIARL